MNNIIRRVLPFLVSATFFMPLLVGNNFIFPFIVPKILFFRSLVLILLGCYILLLISDWQRFRPRFSILTITIVLFWLSFAVSTFVGVDWYHSFWDNHERMLGLFTITHYTILYLIASSVLDTNEDWKIVFRSALVLGSIVMLIGVWQKFVDPEYLLNGGSWRVSATLGNSIYYSGYGLFLMFLGIITYIRERNTTFWKWFGLVVSALGFLGIFLGGTRGAILGLIFGCGTIALSYIFISREKSRIRTLITYLSVVGVVLLVVLFAFRQTTFVSEIPGLGRLLNTSFSLNSTETTRPMAWKVGIEAWKEMPVFGWGPNNFYYAFNKYYNPEFLKFGWNETWFDNAHSVIVNTLVVQGIIGILIYLSIYAVALMTILVGVRRGKVHMHIGFISAGFLVAHLIGLVTVFENPTSYLYFFIFAAFVAHITRAVALKKKQEEVNSLEEGKKEKKQKNIKHISTGAIITLGFVVFCIIYVTDIAPARANKATIAAIQKVYSGSADAKLFEEPLTYSTPHLDDIRNDIARTVSGALPTLVQNGKGEQATTLFTETVQELQKNQLLHPLDVRVHFTLSQILEFGYQATQNKDFLVQSEAALRRATDLSPKRQQFVYALAQNLAEQGKLEEAEKIMKKSIDEYPLIAEGWVRLALIYAAENKTAEAREVAGKVLGWFSGTTTVYLLNESWKPIMEQLISSTTPTSK